jgi:hypothetical protein
MVEPQSDDNIIPESIRKTAVLGIEFRKGNCSMKSVILTAQFQQGFRYRSLRPEEVIDLGVVITASAPRRHSDFANP